MEMGSNEDDKEKEKENPHGHAHADSERLTSIGSQVVVGSTINALLRHLAELSSHPSALDTSDKSIKIDKYDDGYESIKEKLLENAKVVPRPFSSGPKLSKFAIEASWLQEVLKTALNEVEESSSFCSLLEVVSKHDAKQKRLPESIEHMKILNSEMHLIRQQLHAEAATHNDAIRGWSKSISQLKQGIKELKIETKLALKYKADIAVAEADCNRRVREERLQSLKDEIIHLTYQAEAEKQATSICVEFLKKQNLQLREEAISLAGGHENDVQCMDLMINRLRERKIEKEKLLADLEPRYKKEMDAKAAIKAEAERYKHLSLDEWGEIEVRGKAAVKIQKVWRGHSERLKQIELLKELEKIRKDLKKKKKKSGAKGASKKKKK